MTGQEPPHRLGKYEIIEEIGRGGFAVVYRARDTGLDRIVALKVLAPHLTWDPAFAQRFRREAQATARLRHPHIVTIHDVGQDGEQLYIAMEYLPGPTLAQLLEAEGALPLERALPILEQTADALDYAHEQGVIHRDVKPSNVMVEVGRRGDVQATLTDFGLVKAMETSEALTSVGTILGSPEYMAPEQADPDRRDEIGPATDRYALGVVAYHMLTGRVPFPGSTPATLHSHLYEPPPDPLSIHDGLPTGVALVLTKALSKALVERYPSAMAMAEALRQVEVRAEERAREEAEHKARAEAERLAKAEAERRRQERLAAEKAKAERKARVEAEQRAKEEAERRRQEQLVAEKAKAERLAKAEAERRHQERLAAEKAEREAKAAAERRAKEEAERKARKEAVARRPQPVTKRAAAPGFAGKLGLWAWWILTLSVALAVGNAVGWLLSGEGLEGAIGAAVGGAVAGTLQWLALKRILKGAGWWILATSAGWAGSRYLALTVEWEYAHMVVVGVVTGILQWLVLRRTLKKAEWWIFAAGVGRAVAVATAMGVGITDAEEVGWKVVGEAMGLEVDGIVIIAMGMAIVGTVVGAVNGAITGLALVLLPRQDNPGPTAPQPEG